MRSLNSQEGQAARDFGERLYNAVFQGEVRDALRRSLDKADGQADHGLRIRLRLGDAPALLDLPWEYLYDPTLRRFFCHSTTTPLVRYPQQPRPVTPLTVTLPLQVLVLIANPSDVAALDVDGEWRKIESALGALRVRGLVQLTRLENGTLAALQRQLRQGRYHIFHFVGHGGLNSLSGERVLYLEDERGCAHAVGGDHLGTLLRDHRSLRLALLNACEGARATTTDPFAGIAQQVVHQGIPAVIAMQFEITDPAALILAQEFYGALADGYPVEAALAEARKAIFVAGNDVEWGTPVLYSRASDGMLFKVAEIRDKGIRDKEHLPGRSDNDFRVSDDQPAPSRKIDDAPVVPAQSGAGAAAELRPKLDPAGRERLVEAKGPVVRDEERLAAEKAQAERAAKRVFQDERKAAAPVQRKTQKRNWLMIIGFIIGVPLFLYVSMSGYNSYQKSQQPIRATATAQRLQAMATTLAPQISATATAMVSTDGAKLSQVADRFGIEFVPVPGGPFMMGNPEGIGYSDEWPSHEMSVDAFWIGQTEMTNAQYRHFVDANGYEQEQWWTEAGWQWKTENKVTQPAYWEHTKWNGPNQPVVGVSWYEATAYITWLAAETGLPLRLPTEAEWEKAARGVAGQTYPWGDDAPTDQLLNYNGNVGQTTDVGSYPAGASPYGAPDMAGNVWEWTATQWVENYANYADVVSNSKEGDVTRSSRGGSWSTAVLIGVRSANRSGFDPHNRNVNFGFRLVFAPGG